MLREAIAGWTVQKTINILKDKITIKFDEDKLRLEIQTYFDSKREKSAILKNDAKVFGKITEQFWQENIPLIEKSIIGTQQERKQARKELYASTCDALNIYDNAGRREARKIVKEVTGIAKKHYSGMLSTKDHVLKNEIIDGVSESIDSSITSALAEITKLSTSPINYETARAVAEQGNTDLIADTLTGMHGFLDMTHELYPDYGIEIIGPKRYASRPLNNEAINKYPPKFKLKGIATIGDRVLPCLTLNDIEYANRHQQDIVINITEAQKFLGEKMDPFQYEAQQMVGEKLIKKPEPFAPAQPFSIKVDGDTFYEYIELRLEEILDDESIVISNREQSDCGIEINITHNFEHKTSSFTVTIKDKSNKGYLKHLKYMQATMSGSIMEIYSLKEGKNLLEGKCNGFKIDRDLKHIDQEIEFLEWICAIEEKFNISLNMPEMISEVDYNNTKYLYKLISGETIEKRGQDFRMDLTVSEESYDAFNDLKDTEIYLLMNIELNLELFDYSFELPIKRTVMPAKIAEIDRIKEIVKLLKVGEKLTIDIIADKGTFADVLERTPVIRRMKN